MQIKRQGNSGTLVGSHELIAMTYEGHHNKGARKRLRKIVSQLDKIAEIKRAIRRLETTGSVVIP